MLVLNRFFYSAWIWPFRINFAHKRFLIFGNNHNSVEDTHELNKTTRIESKKGIYCAIHDEDSVNARSRLVSMQMSSKQWGSYGNERQLLILRGEKAASRNPCSPRIRPSLGADLCTSMQMNSKGEGGKGAELPESGGDEEIWNRTADR